MRLFARDLEVLYSASIVSSGIDNHTRCSFVTPFATKPLAHPCSFDRTETRVSVAIAGTVAEWSYDECMKQALIIVSLLIMACGAGPEFAGEVPAEPAVTSVGSSGETNGGLVDSVTQAGSAGVAVLLTGGNSVDDGQAGAAGGNTGAEPATDGVSGSLSSGGSSIAGSASMAGSGATAATDGNGTSGSGGSDAIGGTGSCEPVDGCVGKLCGVAFDGCGETLVCGQCNPTVPSSSEGLVCEVDQCISKVLTPPDQRLPLRDEECGQMAGGYFPHAWTGDAGKNGTPCVYKEISYLYCCGQAEACHSVSMQCAGMATRVFDCPQQPNPACLQQVVNGRYLNEWCCP